MRGGSRGARAARALAAAAFLTLSICRESHAEALVVALSPAEVRISSNFTGLTVTVFGAIERDAQTISRAGEYDVVVALSGPPETATVRRKERFLGLWINRGSASLTAPGFYALHASRALAEIAAPSLLRRLGLGAERLLPAVDPPALVPGEVPDAGDPPLTDFGAAFLRLKSESGLYRSAAGTVDFPGASLFTAAFDLPANVPIGAYSATVYLFQSGALLDRQSAGLVVVKAGIEQVLYDASRRWPLLYALAILAAAGSVGWLAGVIFRRD